MSAPDLPRFRVSSLRGYRIRPDATSLPGDKELIDWYVHDSWLGYAEVGRFRSEEAADDVARRLERRNARDLAFGAEEIKPGSTLRHGTVSCYTNLPCRCDQCTEAMRTYHREYKRRRKALANAGK